MGQVRWAGWTMAVATALVISGAHAARADVSSDKPAAIVVYPKVVVETTGYTDTVIRLTNTSTSPINVHCFYVDANSHCSGSNSICSDGGDCSPGEACVPGWVETDFHLILTPQQPIQWEASEGLPGSGAPLPIPFGVCQRNPFIRCASDEGCNPFPGGPCTPSNAGSRIPPVSEVPFVGELKCIAVDGNGTPVARNDLKGEALLETATAAAFDVASYNAIGIQATGATPAAPNVLQLGGDGAPYNGCPSVLILNHFFDDADDPITGNTVSTDLTLVPCSEDFLRQIPGVAVVQYLVFNEFEQRFSTSNTVRCFSEVQLCNIGNGQCNRSIFNVGVAGTLTGQTRMSPNAIQPGLPSGLLGVAIERHGLQSAAFNLHFQGVAATPDIITLP